MQYGSNTPRGSRECPDGLKNLSTESVMEGMLEDTRGSGAASRPYWLIVNQEGTAMEVLTVDLLARGEALAVFSFEEEARMYLRLRIAEPGWRVRQTSAGELVSVLCGPCADATRVALDPVPEPGAVGLVNLLSMDREGFLRTLVSGMPSSTRPARPRSKASSKPVSGVA